MDVVAVLCQLSGALVWPILQWIGYYDKGRTEVAWAIPVGLILTSFGWWECYVTEDSDLGVIRLLNNNSVLDWQIYLRMSFQMDVEREKSHDQQNEIFYVSLHLHLQDPPLLRLLMDHCHSQWRLGSKQSHEHLQLVQGLLPKVSFDLKNRACVETPPLQPWLQRERDSRHFAGRCHQQRRRQRGQGGGHRLHHQQLAHARPLHPNGLRLRRLHRRQVRLQGPDPGLQLLRAPRVHRAGLHHPHAGLLRRQGRREVFFPRRDARLSLLRVPGRGRLLRLPLAGADVAVGAVAHLADVDHFTHLDAKVHQAGVHRGDLRIADVQLYRHRSVTHSQ